MAKRTIDPKLLSLAALSIGVGAAYGGCFLPDYEKAEGEATSSNSPAGPGPGPGAAGPGGNGASGDPGPGGSASGGSGGGTGGINFGGAGPGGASACDSPAQAPSMGMCVMVPGAGGGGGAGGGVAGGGGAPPMQVPCNPVTNEPCDTAAGEACDTAVQSGMVVGFVCYPDGNTKNLCEACDPQAMLENEFCTGTLTCIDGFCLRYCCGDGDCGSGKCEGQGFFDVAPDLGVCVPPQ